MSWDRIKKRNEEKTKSNSSNIVKAINNATGGFWQQVGQNAVQSQRNAEIRKQREQQTKERLNQIKVSPNMNVSPSIQKGSTFQRNIQPSTIKTTPTKVMTQREKEYAETNTPTWQKILNFVNNTKSIIDRKSYDISDNIANKVAKGAKIVGYQARNLPGDFERIDQNLGEGMMNGIKDFLSKTRKARIEEQQNRENLIYSPYEILKNRGNDKLKNVSEQMLEEKTNRLNNLESEIDKIDTNSMLRREKSQKLIEENISAQHNPITRKIAELAPSGGNMMVGSALSSMNPIVRFCIFYRFSI